MREFNEQTQMILVALAVLAGRDLKPTTSSRKERLGWMGVPYGSTNIVRA